MKSLFLKSSFLILSSVFVVNASEPGQVETEVESVQDSRFTNNEGMSETNMFYAQSAAACAYLFLSEDGKRREALLQYLVDYYAGRFDELDLKAAFGMDAEAIGAASKEYAISIGRGGRK